MRKVPLLLFWLVQKHTVQEFSPLWCHKVRRYFSQVRGHTPLYDLPANRGLSMLPSADVETTVGQYANFG